MTSSILAGKMVTILTCRILVEEEGFLDLSREDGDYTDLQDTGRGG